MSWRWWWVVGTWLAQALAVPLALAHEGHVHEAPEGSGSGDVLARLLDPAVLMIGGLVLLVCVVVVVLQRVARWAQSD